MKRGIMYLLGVAGTLYTAMLYSSGSFLLLFYVEMILPVILFLLYLLAIRKVRVGIALPIPAAENGNPVPVHINITNHSLLPNGRIKVKVRAEYPMGKENATFCGNVSAKTRIRCEFTSPCAGRVLIGIRRVWCYDIFGLLAFPLPRRLWSNASESLLVLPGIVGVPVYVSRKSRDFAGESEDYSLKRGGDDPSEVFQIRNYQPGDKIRSIHWKLSAKEDELMIREQSHPLGCPVLMYLNMQNLGENAILKRYSHRRHLAEQWNAYLEVAASLCFGLVQEGCRHYAIWFDSKNLDIRRYRIEKEEDIYEMLYLLCEGKIYEKPLELEEMYQEKYFETAFITKLELNLNLKLTANDFLFQQYSKKKLEQELKQTELQV